MQKVLVTGGAGYIGSHTVLQLLATNHKVIVLDNLSNSSYESLNRVQQLTKEELQFVQGDIRDKTALRELFNQHDITSVIHFAGLKAVGESVEKPLQYYENNVFGTVNLCEVMTEFNVKNFVFSSSATVYGDPVSLPLKENMPTGKPTNPYGMSKLMVENILHDLFLSDDTWNIAILRYFNPVGAHKSGKIGEDPSGIPNNLMPFITQVATGRREKLSVYGNDYDTPDGTGVRDYIHVEDLADGHLKALTKLNQNPGLVTYNLGTGHGYSVLDMINTFEQQSGRKISYKVTDRRAGDIASCYADASLAETELGWKATKGIQDMCADSWYWQSRNPNGYND